MALQDQKAPAEQKSRVASFPPPVGGWNTRDAFPAMAPTDAIIAQNVICQPWQVATRNGSTSWATGWQYGVNTLMPYNAGASTAHKIYAAAATNVGATTAAIYDISAGGAVGAPVVTGLTNSWFQWVNFGTQAGTFLVAVNGADSMQTFNGTSWTATATLVAAGPGPGVTGSGPYSLAMNTIIGIGAYQNTLYFVPNNALGFFYQSAQSIFGTVSYVNLSALATRGGFLQAIATWTVDGGAGPQDYIVFITSEGEFIVYQGSSFATAFGTAGAMALVGVYYIARPLGRRCWIKFGGDCLVLTELGLFPLSRSLQAATIDRTTALTDKIQPTFVQLAALTQANNWRGWQIELCQYGQFLIISVPSTGNFQQLVMQLQSKGWSNWTGWNANCLLYTDGVLYYADAVQVYVAYMGSSDLQLASGSYVPSNIQSTILSAFTQLKIQGQQKHIKLIRPYLTSTGSLQPYVVGSAVDYNQYVIQTSMQSGVSYTGTVGIWDVGLWDSALWGTTAGVQSKQWQTVAQFPCFAFAPYWQFNQQSGQIALTAYDVLFVPGGVL